MNAQTGDSANELGPGERRLDRLLGRQVLARNNQPVGRLEEIRAEIKGHSCIVTEYVIGTAGLLERLGMGVKLLAGGARGRGYVARWDQLDIRDPDHPRLTCAPQELRRM